GGISWHKYRKYTVLKRGCCKTFKKGEQQPFLLFELNIGGIIGIVFIVDDKSNSVKSFWKMGGGEENLFSKRCLPRKTFLQQPLLC
ncbi:MAG: hypothetical protein J6S53_06975, partial [Lentisphaeria bacterium]|nr:hypothetical protein [Lentisphaeria bacterium]